MTAQFRIGGHYKQRNGAVVQVMSEGPYTGCNGDFYPGRRVLSLAQGGSRNINGACCSIVGSPLSELDLLPGELHNVNGEWVPVTEEAPKTSGQFYDEGWNAAHDGLPFNPMGTRDWRDGWSDYHAADPDHKIRLDDELAAVVREAMTPEKVRPPLTWATPKPVDRWEGYVTLRTTVAQDPTEPVHPLQRMTDPSDPLHGSAFLRKG